MKRTEAKGRTFRQRPCYAASTALLSACLTVATVACEETHPGDTPEAPSAGSGATGSGGGAAGSGGSGTGGHSPTGGGGGAAGYAETGGGGSSANPPWTVKGTFVGAAVKGTGAAVTVSGTFTWSAAIHGNGGEVTVEGWLR